MSGSIAITPCVPSFLPPSFRTELRTEQRPQLLNYPTSHSLTLTPPGASSPSFIAKLLEDDVPEDKTSAKGRFEVPTFHGFSKNGTAKGQLVYAGHGTKAEFLALQAQGPSSPLAAEPR
mgnify:CR=1 FL=1